MVNVRDHRVDDALQQLVARLVPPNPEEDEAVEDQRWDEALESARNLIDNEPSPSVAEDVNHAADLIRKKLIRENDRPDKASKFSNLYSRLLSQPVLGQKWAILYFLYQLADNTHDDIRKQLDDIATEKGSADYRRLEEEKGARAEIELGRNMSGRTTRTPSAVNSPTFNEAFSRNGLPRLPRTETPDSPKPPPHRDRDRQPPRPAPERKVETPQESEMPREVVAQGPPEAALLRDLPFTLQGLSSTNLPFSNQKSLNLPPGLPVPIISLLHTLAEPSLLYRSLAQFVDSSEGGLVGQSLRSAIGIELRSYLGLVATLEGQIRRSLAQLDESLPHQGLGKAGVTLKRCVVWTREATMGLRLMSMLVEESKGRKGGELISLIHSFSSSHGDPFVHTFAERLLLHVTKPFYGMLRHWIYDGELEDPFLEFFVYEDNDNDNGDLDPRRGGATSVWEDKYALKDPMVPSIMTSDFAKKIFLIGKSLNFISYGCGDSAWVESYSKECSRELHYGDTATLESSIDEAYKRTMARLIHLMEDKFKLFDHLAALKKYLLLGQGDFIALLMESLASNLDRPANSQYRHTLTAQLEHAIRNSNAQYDSPEVLRRLDARMLELSHGEIGWDVFTLEYRMDSPLDVIVTPWASKQYLKVFNFLWRVKRVEFALGSTWRRCMTGARGVLGAVDDKMGKDWKSARGGMAEMIHFVNQLQYYILFEVIEAGWEGLQAAIRKPDATLDTLISAHTSYLRSITRKGLLASSSSATSTSSHASPDFTSQLHELLKLMLAYKDAVENLYSYSVAEFTRRQDTAAKIEARTANNGWGLTERDESISSPSILSSTSKPGKRTTTSGTNPTRPPPLNNARSSAYSRSNNREEESDSPIPPLLPLPANDGDETTLLTALRDRLTGLEKEFRARVNVLLGDLAHQPDTDMRFLGVVMNFNDVYRPVRRQRRTHAHAHGHGQGQGQGQGHGREKERVRREGTAEG